MDEDGRVRFGIKIIRFWKGMHSIGIGLTKQDKEAYLAIRLIFWQITIGRFWQWND